MDERRRIIRVIAADLGMKYIEIADLWNVKYKTVKSYMSPKGKQGPSASQVKIMQDYAEEKRNN